MKLVPLLIEMKSIETVHINPNKKSQILLPMITSILYNWPNILSYNTHGYEHKSIKDLVCYTTQLINITLSNRSRGGGF